MMTAACARHALVPPRWLRVGALVLLVHGGLLWQLSTWDRVPAAPGSSSEPILAQVLIDEPATARVATALAPRTDARPTAQPQRTERAVPAPTPSTHPAPSSTTATSPAIASAATSGSASPGHAATPTAAAGTDSAPRSRANESALVLPSADAAYLQNPPPVYPRMSKRLGEQGTVLLRVFINAQGQPERVELRTSSGFARLDQSALEAVPRWRFVPGQRQGVAEAMWFNVPVRFVLE